MGNAAFWYEPKGSDTVVKIDLGQRLSDLQVIPARDLLATRTLSGHQSRTLLRSQRRLRVESMRFTSLDLVDDLLAMQAALEAGGRVSLAEDTATAWAAFADPWSGTTTLTVMRSPFALYGGTVTAGDRLSVLGPSPRMLTEDMAVASVGSPNPATSGGPITTTRARRHGWAGEDWILVRDSGFWPILRLPFEEAGVQIIQHKHRRYFTLILTLDEDTAGIAALASTPTVTLQGTTDTGKPTLGDHLASLGAT